MMEICVHSLSSGMGQVPIGTYFREDPQLEGEGPHQNCGKEWNCLRINCTSANNALRIVFPCDFSEVPTCPHHDGLPSLAPVWK